MFPKTIHRFLSTDDRYIKLLCWLVFLIELPSYWRFHHLMILDTFAPYGVNDLTLICLMVVLALLPYSISHKWKLDIHWYALSFLPSVAILTLIANEQITITEVLPAVLLGALYVFLMLTRKKLLSRIGNGVFHFRAINSNIWILILLMIYALIFTNTNDIAHYSHAIHHYVEAKKWDKALSVGKRSLRTDSTMFSLRAEAMLEKDELGDILFSYPVPTHDNVIKIDTPLSAKEAGDVLLCNLLLKKDLNGFISTLPRWYDIHSPKLPKHYKEAIVVFLSQSVSTALVYSDTMTEANYADFLAEKKKYTDPIEANSMCSYLYGDTYFWYYFFFKPVSDHDK